MGLFSALELLKAPPVDYERRRAVAEWVVRVLEERDVPTEIARCLLVQTLGTAEALLDDDAGLAVVINYIASLHGIAASDFRCSPRLLH